MVLTVWGSVRTSVGTSPRTLEARHRFIPVPNTTCAEICPCGRAPPCKTPIMRVLFRAALPGLALAAAFALPSTAIADGAIGTAALTASAQVVTGAVPVSSVPQPAVQLRNATGGCLGPPVERVTTGAQATIVCPLSAATEPTTGTAPPPPPPRHNDSAIHRDDAARSRRRGCGAGHVFATADRRVGGRLLGLVRGRPNPDAQALGAADLPRAHVVRSAAA